MRGATCIRLCPSPMGWFKIISKSIYERVSSTNVVLPLRLRPRPRLYAARALAEWLAS